jgi:MFS family permease
MTADRGYRVVLRNKDFRTLYIGAIISQLGNSLTRVALPFFALQVTHSVTSMGIIIGLQMLPWVVVGPTVNVYLDRFPRKSTLIVISLLQFLLMLALPFVNEVSILYIFAFLMGSGETLWTAIKSAVNPDLVSRANYSTAASLNAISYEVMSVVGPAAGGFLTVMLGCKTIFILDSVTFLLLALFVLNVRVPTKIQEKSRGYWKELQVGFGFITGNPAVRFNLYLVLAEGALLALLDANLVVFVKKIIHLGGQGYGIALTCGSAGAILGGIITARLDGKVKRYKLLTLGTMMQGIVLIPLFLVNGLAGVLIAWLFYGLFNAMGDVASNVYLAEETPGEIRGRVYSGMNAISCGTGSLGALGIGPAAALLGSRWIFPCGGAAIGVLVLLLLKTPAFAKLKETEGR